MENILILFLDMGTKGAEAVFIFLVILIFVPIKVIANW